MPAVGLWTGREARALRGALRLSVRAFAEHLGVAARTVSKWEKLGQATHPIPISRRFLTRHWTARAQPPRSASRCCSPTQAPFIPWPRGR